jgi:hypothetical protein
MSLSTADREILHRQFHLYGVMIQPPYLQTMNLPCSSNASLILHSIRIVLSGVFTDPENIITSKVKKSKIRVIPYEYFS